MEWLQVQFDLVPRPDPLRRFQPHNFPVVAVAHRTLWMTLDLREVRIEERKVFGRQLHGHTRRSLRRAGEGRKAASETRRLPQNPRRFGVLEAKPVHQSPWM